MIVKSFNLFSGLLLLLLLSHEGRCTCWEVFSVDGRLTSPNSRGVFVSENFPHSLPVESYCVYDFKVTVDRATDLLCIRFKELELYTVDRDSSEETQILIGGANKYEAFLAYSGNGSLIWERSNGTTSLRPHNLLSGPLCLKIFNGNDRHKIAVVNKQIKQNSLGRVTRFYAEYQAMDSGSLQGAQQLDSLARKHRCQDGSHVNISSRCNLRNDCGRNLNQVYSDFFVGISSDESYEHARCNSSSSFATNFALGQVSAQSLMSTTASLDCSRDHSRHFPTTNSRRDCSLRLPSSSSDVINYWLSGIRATANPRSATCYRFFWQSNGPSMALILMEPSSGQVYLRLPARSEQYWNLVEVQLDASFLESRISMMVVQSGLQNRTAATYWLDDLSSEPRACDDSTYESRMPTVCSFEWSTCGWDTTYLQIIYDTQLFWLFNARVNDHTSSFEPDRKPQQYIQRQNVLMIQPSSRFHEGILKSKRRLPFGTDWCFEIWFYGIGLSGYSIKVEARIAGIHPTNALLLTATAPINSWSRLSGHLESTIAKSPVVSITISVAKRDQLLRVILDDLAFNRGECGTVTNGSVQCGLSEWTCYNRQQCIPVSNRCDGRIHCSDASDESNCFESSSGQAWSIILRVTIGITVSVVAFLTLSVCLHKRRIWLNRRARSQANQQQRQRPRTVTDGRLPRARSDRISRRPDMPPSYDDVAAGAANAGFAAYEEPPKYNEITQAMVMQTASQHQQQQQISSYTPSLNAHPDSQNPPAPI